MYHLVRLVFMLCYFSSKYGYLSIVVLHFIFCLFINAFDFYGTESDCTQQCY